MIPELTSNLTEDQKIIMNQVTINTAINDLQTDTRELQKIVIKGNGELPLRESVRNHEAFIKDVKYWTRFIGGALVLQTIAFSAGLVLAYFKFLPVLEQIAHSGVK